jgi:hypothetical protein
MPPENCPNCGADVPTQAKCCPECGADEQSGWSDTAYADKLGIPHDSFDYDEFVKDEFNPARTKPRGIHWIWWITALILVLLFLVYWLH